MENVINNLQEFGLRRIEAQVYVFLLKNGSKTVNELVQALNVSKSQIYYLLRHLHQQKFVKANTKRPTTFSATDIQTILNLVVDSKIQQAEKMKASKKLFRNKKL